MTTTSAPPAVDGTRPRPRTRRFPLLAVLLLAALAVTLAGIFPFRQMIAQNRQVALTQERYAALVAENGTLEQRITQLETPAEVERIAREEMGLVRPGEIGFRAVPAPGVEATVEVPVGTTEHRPIWQRVWDFLTGRDLVPDG